MTATFRFDAGIGRVELARPERHNAMDAAMAEALAQALDQAEAAGSALKGLIVAGAGKSFCSGADVKMLEGSSAAQARDFMVSATWSFRRLERMPVPVVAEVHGYCLGGGLELLLHCDLAVASDDAVFGLPEVRHGWVTTAGSVGRLAAAIGTMQAKDLLLTGRRVPAAEAKQLGLVSRVVPAADLARATQELAAELARHPVEGLTAMKQLLRGRARDEGAASWLDELEAFEGLLKKKGPGHG